MRIDTEQVGLRFLGISDKAAVEAAARPLDVGQKCSEHAASATLRRRDRQTGIAKAAHQTLGLIVQMIWKSRPERFAQPRSPFVGAVAGAVVSPRSPAD
jgi:hypothetical protein